MGSVESFRKRRGWTQQELAVAVGLRSKGYISAVERGVEGCSLRLALKLEQVSGGELKATELCPEAAALLPAPRPKRRR